jgi:hypothetical protein
MAKTVQDCIARKLWKFQRKMEDNHIFISGTQCHCAVIDVEYDKYNNTYQSVRLSNYINVLLDFPMDEIPTSSQNTNSSSDSQSNVLHMYDILPINAYFKNEDVVKYNIRRDTVIVFKLRNFDDTFQVIKLQVTDAVSKGNVSSGVYAHNFIVAPITSYQLLNDPEFKSIIEDLKNRNDW